jgi:oligopeptide transport system permease protein
MQTISQDLFRKIDDSSANAVIMTRPSITYWQDARARLLKNKVAVASAVFIALVSISSVVIPQLISYDYETQEIWNKHASPNAGMDAIVEVPVKYTEKLDATATAVDSAAAAPVTDPPASPSALKIVGEPTTRQIVLEWDRVAGATEYHLYRSIAKDTLGVPLGDIKKGVLSYIDTASLDAAETYYYAVTAANAMGEGSPSQTIAVKPRLTLSLDDAKKINPSIKSGDPVRIKPHYLGTDYLGRDMLARLMVGASISLLIGLIAPLIFVLIGIVYGSVSGYFGGMVDNIMMRIADIIVTIPNLLVLIMLQVVLGSGPVTLIIALVIADWAAIGQQVRGEILRIREMEFVNAAELLGTSFWKIIFRHLLPNVMGTVLVLFSIAIPRVIFTEAFLSFIGLGIAPPVPSLGSVTREGAAVMSTYPLEMVVPAILLSLTVLAFNLLGDGVRDALDPKQRGTR